MPPRPSAQGLNAGAAAALAAQGLVLVVAAIYYAYKTLAGDAGFPVGAVATAALATACAVAVLAVAVGVRSGSRWARSPAVVTEVLLLAVAVPLVTGERWYVGVALVASAIVVLGLITMVSVSTADDT